MGRLHLKYYSFFFFLQSMYLLEAYFIFFYLFTDYHTKRDTVIFSIFQMINED